VRPWAHPPAIYFNTGSRLGAGFSIPHAGSWLIFRQLTAKSTFFAVSWSNFYQLTAPGPATVTFGAENASRAGRMVRQCHGLPGKCARSGPIGPNEKEQTNA